MMKSRSHHLLLALCFLIIGCTDDPIPKPHGYFRIDLPASAYAEWVDPTTFSAELPTYAQVVERKTDDAARWYDLRFPAQRATVHLTWSQVNGRLNDLIEDAHAFKGKHEVMAVRIGRERVLRDSARVYGTLFDVDGDVASPLVFYLTDSTDNFLYGALYFDRRPNADSLAPVTDRIRKDMRHMANTLQWSE